MESQPIHNPEHVKAYDARRQKRADRLFHWSLDMPPEDDDVDVRVQRNQSGVTWKEMAVVAASLLSGFGLYGWMSQPPKPEPTKTEQTEFQDTDTQRILRFTDDKPPPDGS